MTSRILPCILNNFLQKLSFHIVLQSVSYGYFHTFIVVYIKLFFGTTYLNFLNSKLNNKTIIEKKIKQNCSQRQTSFT